MMKIIDVSLPICSEMVVWEGDPKPRIHHDTTIAEQGTIQVSSICMGGHTGTHIDAPAHFIPGGNGIDQLPVSLLVGSVQVIKVDDENGLVSSQHIREQVQFPIPLRVLLKTQNSNEGLLDAPDFSRQYVALSLEAAEYLVAAGVKVVGIDYLSIAPFDDVYPVHQKLLQEDVVIIEGLDLRGVRPGIYTLVALPLKIINADGSPARVLLLGEEWPEAGD
ncbi:MAG: cyclase family protein [Anaerolineae bacterium]|nr:cyclase family protein [Anaerolineae bacterium]